MIFKINLEQNHSIIKFLKINNLEPNTLINAISARYNNYAVLVNNKIKVIPKIRHNQKNVFEFKVPLSLKNVDFVRVAYTLNKQILHVFFISTKTVKMQFMQELLKTSLID